MNLTTDLSDRLRRTINPQRLVDTAVQLVAVPSRTGEAGAVSDRLADILTADGFRVERPAGGHPTAPAVAVRFRSGKPGRTLQFNGHLDTVHLPFVPPKVQDGRITGSGSSDMKSGIAAAVEALRALRDTGALPGGAVLLTAHDLHETPWGDGRQLNQLIADGYVGDAVLLPEYLNECLPVIGRGGLTWKVTVSRPGPPIHEVMRPAEPSVIAAGAELVARLNQLHDKVSAKSDAMAGSESVFIGQVHSGEIFNQYPQECRLEGTRRWLPGTRQEDVVAELRGLFDGLARDMGTTVAAEFHPMRDAFLLPQDDPFVAAFQQAYAASSGGQPLKVGAKPFCDDGNTFWALARVPAVTHGPRAGGAHTLEEWVSIDDLVRVAHLYALTAVAYCGEARARA
ncbi:MAG TPA: M20/M25/M40 family metallo-hydrolase [Gemmataceae bacterium]|nr:M20/M25/M40 family metallo-hydrolase [Gemmataceae bacterium]